jgi:hypothetical protein
VQRVASTLPGHLDSANSEYVLETLRSAVDGCTDGTFAAMVTAPVHKGVINDAGIAFSGHTEFLADRSGGYPVMMLACPGLKVVPVTIHIPLAEVPGALTPALLRDTIAGVHLDRLEAQGRFGLADPAETGMLWGQLCPLLWAPPWRGGRVSLTIMPDFDRPGFSGEGQLALHLVPLRLAWPALRFALTEGRRAWFAT